jgi:hypothetical protein
MIILGSSARSAPRAGDPSDRQRGAIIPLFVIALVALLGMVGMALDLGHFYVNRTRLQNALDAAALSGAKTLDQTDSTAAATSAAHQAFTLNASADGNAELQAIPIEEVEVSFATNLMDSFTADGGSDPRFVRASVARFSTGSWLIQLLGIDSLDQPSSAVAGPSPVLGQVCDLLPVAPCGTPGAENFGYALGQEVVLKTGNGNKGWEVGPGNYQNVQLDCGAGADCIRDEMAGKYRGCAIQGDTILTKPGKSVGANAQGLNTRFDCPHPGCGGVDTSEYRPDVVIDAGSGGYRDYYSDYVSDRADPSHWDLQPSPGGPAQLEPPRRVVAAPVIDCSGTVNGQGSVAVLGVSCLFLTRPAAHNGSQEIYGEFLTECVAEGRPGPDPVTGPGPHTIVLYKDFDEQAADR